MEFWNFTAGSSDALDSFNASLTQFNGEATVSRCSTRSHPRRCLRHTVSLGLWHLSWRYPHGPLSSALRKTSNHRWCFFKLQELQRPRGRSLKLGRPTWTQGPQQEKGSVQSKSATEQLRLAAGDEDSTTKQPSGCSRERGGPVPHLGSFQRGRSGGAEGSGNTQTTQLKPQLYISSSTSFWQGNSPLEGLLFSYLYNGADQIFVFVRKDIVGPSGKELACQYRRPKRCGFDLWVRKNP